MEDLVMGLYVGNQRYTPVIRSDTQIYCGSFNIVTDLGLTINATEQQIATALATEIINPGIANYCFVDVPFEYYTEVSGYDSFSGTSDYVGYYVVYNDAYTLVTNDNKDSVGITAGTTIAYNINYRDYFKYIYRFKYNGSAWVYEYDTDFSGCANVDASNFTDYGTTLLSNLGYPSTRYESLTLGATGTIYTAPANGWVQVTKNAGIDFGYLDIKIIDDNDNDVIIDFDADYRTAPLSPKMPVMKGQRFKVTYNATGTLLWFRFVYAIGNPTP